MVNVFLEEFFVSIPLESIFFKVKEYLSARVLNKIYPGWDFAS